ncbi:MAG TPA: MazF family transcriptional regulator [Gammaproteobacteria bacterium]|nr:MazF family transcriptional regulator [Gammaproteobacteria bacterium]MBK83376.1 MazF family transcriptional regulator [Gammaproteobacteria bacterium]HBF08090.1 MazF family transcriptional regulator [Gammaproteobacteria bacterium]HCK91721.1 MazF family transcriptional regulator [Gammaproteobacteria bacterium]|tara:strand:- start:561 stop:929 length:369 start_codon:yes stop_codon:yes gene_type:complete
MKTNYTPSRGDIIYLDFEPTKGKEIGKYRPALVLSSQTYNKKTGLLICCPISTSIRGGKTEVPLHNLDKPSVVAASLIQTLSWKERKAKLIAQAESNVIDEVLARILPLIGAEKIYKNSILK